MHSSLKPVQGGSVVFVSSFTAFSPAGPLGMYAVSKTALVGLTKALAAELGPAGIRVNCIAPGAPCWCHPCATSSTCPSLVHDGWSRTCQKGLLLHGFDACFVSETSTKVVLRTRIFRSAILC